MFTKNKRNLIELLLIIVISLGAHTSCDLAESTRRIEYGELPGVYVPTYVIDGKEFLKLNNDSTYLHVFIASSGKKHSQSGTWMLVNNSGVLDYKPRVNFEDFQNWYPMRWSCASDWPDAKIDSSPRRWGAYVLKRSDGSMRLKRCPKYRQYYLMIHPDSLDEAFAL